MPNSLIPAKDVGKVFYETAVKSVKKIIPDRKGQNPKTLNKKQKKLLAGFLNALAFDLFYGYQPR